MQTSRLCPRPAKKINGRKRHALVDTDDRGLVIEPYLASIHPGHFAMTSCGSRPLNVGKPIDYFCRALARAHENAISAPPTTPILVAGAGARGPLQRL
jgi:hypothetical protein